MSTTGYAYHEIFCWHDPGGPAGLMPSDPRRRLQPHHHIDHAETRRRIHDLLAMTGRLDHLQRLRFSPVSDAQVLTAHTRRCVDMLREANDGAGGDAGAGMSPFGRGGYDIIKFAAGGAVFEELAGRPAFGDPYQDLVEGFGGQDLQPHQRDEIAVDAGRLDALGAVR